MSSNHPCSRRSASATSVTNTRCATRSIHPQYPTRDELCNRFFSTRPTGPSAPFVRTPWTRHEVAATRSVPTIAAHGAPARLSRQRPRGGFPLLRRGANWQVVAAFFPRPTPSAPVFLVRGKHKQSCRGDRSTLLVVVSQHQGGVCVRCFTAPRGGRERRQRGGAPSRKTSTYPVSHVLPNLKSIFRSSKSSPTTSLSSLSIVTVEVNPQRCRSSADNFLSREIGSVLRSACSIISPACTHARALLRPRGT